MEFKEIEKKYFIDSILLGEYFNINDSTDSNL